VISNVSTAGGANVLNLRITLRPGDADDNNFVDGDDLNILLSAFGGDVDDPNSPYDERADFNCDGFNDGDDLNILLTNFGAEGDP